MDLQDGRRRTRSERDCASVTLAFQRQPVVIERSGRAGTSPRVHPSALPTPSGCRLHGGTAMRRFAALVLAIALLGILPGAALAAPPRAQPTANAISIPIAGTIPGVSSFVGNFDLTRFA